MLRRKFFYRSISVITASWLVVSIVKLIYHTLIFLSPIILLISLLYVLSNEN